MDLLTYVWQKAELDDIAEEVNRLNAIFHERYPKTAKVFESDEKYTGETVSDYCPEAVALIIEQGRLLSRAKEIIEGGAR